MHNEENYLQEEERRFYSQKNKPYQPISMARKVLLCLILIVSAVSLYSKETHAPNKGIFGGDTWTCQKCGYSSYVEIKRCPVCGLEKPRTKR